MQTDFLDACERHWHDAELLFNQQRWANADHLYGFAAECGLKSLMRAFGMVVRQDGSPDCKKDKVHANEIWLRYDTYRSNHVSGINYALPNQQPFSNWNAADRYTNQSNFDQTNTQAHKEAANLVRNLIRKAKLEGLI